MLTISAKGQKEDERIRVQHGASQIQMLVKRSGTNISVDSGGNDDYPASPCVAPSTGISSYIKYLMYIPCNVYLGTYLST